MGEPGPPRHILILTDRDWTHPQAGGTGTNLHGLVSRWLAWGHRVTVVAGDHEHAARVERPAPGLELHRVGTRLTVFPRAAWLVKRGAIEDVDVVLEVVNGIAFFTPLWRLRVPRVAVVHHVHRDMYVEELGRRGAIAAWLLETLPLRHLYTGTPVITDSEAARASLVELGIDPSDISVIYNGVEADAFHHAERSPEPTLLYLGRIKRYKRLEILLDVLERIPGAHLHVAGDGDHRPAFEADIAARGLQTRVTLHGFVDERTKRELLARSWVALTASSAEGWCLTVIEAAACGTPSAALRVGGLAESIVDGETGVLADEPAELTARVRELVEHHERRERMGAAARDRARTFTWDRAAEQVQAVLARAPAPRLRGAAAALAARPAGVAAATLAANALSLVLTMVLARALGAEGYGALAALTSAFLILAVPGAALQLEAAAGRLTLGVALPAAIVVVAAASVVLRGPLADLAGVDEPWAAAIVPAAGLLWLALSIRRGELQGAGRHGAVARSLLVEGAARLAAAVALVAVGLGVAGALLGTAIGICVAITALGFAPRGPARVRLRDAATRGVVPRGAARVRPRDAATGGVVPRGAARVRRHDIATGGVVALVLLAIVQQVDVIVAQHRLDPAAASSYAAAAVASKVVVWAAVGLALALLPELSRHARRGAEDGKRLARTLALVLAVAAPFALVCLIAGRPLLDAVFGPELDGAADALPWLAAAMTLFACASVAVQHSLALGRRALVPVLAAVALAEPLLLRSIGREAEDIAVALVLLQLALAVVAVAQAVRTAPRLEAQGA